MPTCPTWSHFIQDKLNFSIYLSLDKCKICIKSAWFNTVFQSVNCLGTERYKLICTIGQVKFYYFHTPGIIVYLQAGHVWDLLNSLVPSSSQNMSVYGVKDKSTGFIITIII